MNDNMFMMRTLEIEKTAAKDTPYDDITLLQSSEYKRGLEILNTGFARLVLSDSCRTVLFSPRGCYMLGHNPPLITVEQAAKFHTGIYLKEVVSIDGIIMLKHEPPLMTIEQMLSVPILMSLQALISKYGVIARKEELMSVEEAKKINFFNLKSILTQNGLIALREGLIKVSQLINHAKWGGSLHVYYLTTLDGMKCMRDKSMTYDLSQTMHEGALRVALEKLSASAKSPNQESLDQDNVSSFKCRR